MKAVGRERVSPVLHVVREASGGMVSHLAGVVEGLCDAGLAVHVAAPPSTLEALSGRLERGRPCFRPYALPVRDGVRPADDLRCIAYLALLTRSLGPSIVHAHGFKAAAIAAGARAFGGVLAGRRRARFPLLVVTVHNHLPQRPGRWRGLIDRSAAGHALRRADGVIYVSDTLRGALDPLVRRLAPEQPACTVTNGLAPRWFSLRRAGAGGREGTGAIFTCVTRLIPSKGLSTLVDAVERLRTGWGCGRCVRQPPWQVWIVGDGPMRGELERRVAETGAGGLVRFWGHRGDVDAILTRSDVAVFPSVSEGARPPYAVLEAMAVGLPIVGVEGSGAEVAPSALIVPAGCADALARAMARLAENPELRRHKGRQARRIAMSRYTRARMVDDTIRFYLRVAGEARPSHAGA